MKKKILIAVVAVLVIAGGIVAYMAMTGGEVTEADKAQDKKSDQELSGEGGALEDPESIKMETADPSLDSIENAVELEEFDPNDI